MKFQCAFITVFLICVTNVELAVIKDGDCFGGIVNCFVDPCSSFINHGCPGHPTAVCHSNYCGGCNADWYEVLLVVTFPGETIIDYGGLSTNSHFLGEGDYYPTADWYIYKNIC
ncbi:hypothetical protein DPMN_185445 [Dreissena polymorpha]|uniref:Uncharacterized protein n=1 Tax=Dreissena polymorpha TaxID=45954 RepID=A0A9D4DMT9_DREPO|nr:hypothetical protein DPMN_185445 [Dreissena polymorpha]